MQRRNLLALSLAVAGVGLSANAYGQSFQIADSVSFPAAGIASTDDTAPNQGGNAVNYTSMTIQSYAAPSVVDVPNGNIQGAGSPYIIGTLGYVVLTSAHGSASSSTAFYLNPTTDQFVMFGQYSASSTLNYQDNGATTSYNGITNQPEDFHNTASLSGENASGQVIGYQTIEAPDSSSNSILGRHAYEYSIPTNSYVSLGLTQTDNTGAVFSTTFSYTNISSASATGTYASSTSIGIDNSGNACGTSTRYYNWGGVVQSSSSAGGLGTAAWYYNATTGQTSEIGLMGAGYNYTATVTGTATGTGTYVSEASKGCDGGYSVGTATAYPYGTSSSSGSEDWEYNATTGITTAVSLYQNGGSPSIAGFGSTYSGTPLTWSYTGTSGSATATTLHSSTMSALNSQGQVAGASPYYAGTSSSKGQIAWIYTPTTGAYQQVGLTTNGFASGGTSSFVSTTAQISSTVSYLNNAGQSTGTSTEYLSSAAGGAGSTSTTTVAWFATPGGTPYQIGPNDAAHTAVSATYGSYLSDTVTEMNQNGLVAGTSPKFLASSTTTNGQDAWVYDPNTAITYVLDPFPTNPNYYFYSVITYLSDTGVAVGEYKTSSSQAYYQAFEWIESSNDFIDLTSTTPETDPNTTELTDAFNYNPANGDVFALGSYVSNGTVYTPGGGVFVLAPVPEPASLSLIAGISVPGCTRRLRRRRGAF